MGGARTDGDTAPTIASLGGTVIVGVCIWSIAHSGVPAALCIVRVTVVEAVIAAVVGPSTLPRVRGSSKTEKQPNIMATARSIEDTPRAFVSGNLVDAEYVSVSWRDERLQELLRSGEPYDVAERIPREEVVAQQRQKQRERKQRTSVQSVSVKGKL